jgi:hypothetical protein
VTRAFTPLGAGWTKADVNREIRYHSEISMQLTAQRTALESALIPVTAYILVACVECYRRYPEMIEAIAAATPPEELGAAGHDFANQIDNVHLWASSISGTGPPAPTDSEMARVRRGTRAARLPTAITCSRSRSSARR